VALDLLLDNEIGIVSLGGRAGTGKSALALSAGLEAVLEKRHHKKVVIFRPLYAVGGQELGYLPGSENEKMSPWAQAVFDTLGALVSQQVIDEIIDRGLIEVLPLTHIRGRSLHDSYVIVDEAQSLERGVLLTVLSRIGQNSRVILTHDVAQRDNLRVGRHDGVVAVVESLKGHPHHFDQVRALANCGSGNRNVGRANQLQPVTVKSVKSDITVSDLHFLITTFL
jgi:PhoH-like ATPase